MERECRHQCLIYGGAPSQQLSVLVAAIQRKLEEGNRCFYLNSPPMVAGLRSCLAAKGTDVVREEGNGRLILSSETVLSPGGSFDIDLMLDKLESALDRALHDGYNGLWASGDMTWEFGPKKDFSKLMEYECRLEELFRKRAAFSGVCQYHRDTLPAEAVRQALLTHGAVFINETLSRVNPHFVPSGFLSDHVANNTELDTMIQALCHSQEAGSAGQRGQNHIRMIEQLELGDHAALFFQTKEEQLKITIPFIATGLERNERCMYITMSTPPPAVRRKLEEYGVDVVKAEENGSLRVVTQKETYLRHGLFEPEKMITELCGEVQAAIDLGYAGFRATGDLSWALDLPSAMERLVAYEEGIEEQFHSKFAALC
jgi:hypothetical protein